MDDERLLSASRAPGIISCTMRAVYGGPLKRDRLGSSAATEAGPAQREGIVDNRNAFDAKQLHGAPITAFTKRQSGAHDGHRPATGRHREAPPTCSRDRVARCAAEGQTEDAHAREDCRGGTQRNTRGEPLFRLPYYLTRRPVRAVKNKLLLTRYSRLATITRWTGSAPRMASSTDDWQQRAVDSGQPATGERWAPRGITTRRCSVTKTTAPHHWRASTSYVTARTLERSATKGALSTRQSVKPESPDRVSINNGCECFTFPPARWRPRTHKVAALSQDRDARGLTLQGALATTRLELRRPGGNGTSKTSSSTPPPSFDGLA